MTLIRDLVEVPAVETVVRLDGRSGRLRELVVTEEVAQGLVLALTGALGETGAALFVVGHYGSGKSHFLAALAELLADPASAASLPGWTARATGLAASARPSLVVAVPLIEHRAEAALEEVVWELAWRAAGASPPALGTDRPRAWGALLERCRPRGLAFLLDELSEFLRAKAGAPLTEDLRFLQFLGEWARSAPVLVACALQENIDEVANVSRHELSRIRDRYPSTLRLSMRHVEDLVRGRLVRLRPGADREVERIYRDHKRAFPRWKVTPERFLACYPIHPLTLELLDSLRFLLSQQRGVVDFICRRLRGDGTAGIPPHLDRPAAELVTGDAVYDHFEDRLRGRPETNRLVETVVPYFAREAPQLFPDEADRALALRVVKLLTLAAASPLERGRTGPELAEALLARVSSLDPEANYAMLESGILEVLASEGAYVVGHSAAGGTRYEVKLESDVAVIARARVTQARAELRPDDRRPLETLLERGANTRLPFDLLREAELAEREITWQNTPRKVLVRMIRGGDLEEELPRLEAALSGTAAEVCLLIGEPETGNLPAPAGRPSWLAWWQPRPLRAEELDFVLDLHCRRLVLAAATAEGRTEGGGVVDFLSAAGRADDARARELLAELYFQGRLDASLREPLDLPSQAGLPFERTLTAIAGGLLQELHPLHREIQPLQPLVAERQLGDLVDCLATPRITVVAAERDRRRSLLDAYLVRLGLVRRQRDAYVLAPDPSRSPAVAELLRLVPGGRRVTAAAVVEELGKGALGLTRLESVLVLNAALQSGLLKGRRGARPVTGPFQTLAEISDLQAGELLPPELRPRVAELPEIFGPGPFEPWNAHLQQASWQYAQAFLQQLGEEAAQVRLALGALEMSPPPLEVRTRQTLAELDQIDPILHLDLDAGPVTGIAALLERLGDPRPALEATRRIERLARFLRAEAESLQRCLGYMAHQELVIPPESAYGEIRALHEEAVEVATAAFELASEDRAAEVSLTFQRFQRAFAAAYASEHEAWRAGGVDAGAVTGSPEYRALQALAAAEGPAVDDDRVRIDRALAAALPNLCRRAVETELAWRPSCACGFRLGTLPPAVDVAGLVAASRRGIRQHLALLASPEFRKPLQAAAGDLVRLGRDEAAADLERLLALAAEPDPDPIAVEHLALRLSDTLRSVLRGDRLIFQRDLGLLRDDLAGRRFPRRRLQQLIDAWLALGEVPDTAFLEIVDSGETAAAVSRSTGSPTLEILRREFPGLAAELPAGRAAEVFWLAAWWAGRTSPPSWIAATLLERGPELSSAARAAGRSAAARRELAEIDSRAGPGSLAGEQIARVLELGSLDVGGVIRTLVEERILSQPVRLAASELVLRLAASPQLAAAVDLSALRDRHPLVTPAALAALESTLAAARLLAEHLRRPPASDRDLLERSFPELLAAVPGLLAAAETAVAAGAWLDLEPLGAFASAFKTTLARADHHLREAAARGFEDCLRIWEVGESVLAPLLAVHPRVAVLMVDAMRADLWQRVLPGLRDALPGRALDQRWAVVPEPTRTAESVASLYTGRPQPAGSAPPLESLSPFRHLGCETSLVPNCDRDDRWRELRTLWASGPRLSVAAAGGIDERLHRTPVDLAALLDESVAGLARRVLPSLADLPAEVPLVVMSDHGFRENPGFRGSEGRYTHGGLSLFESVVPVAIFSPGA